MKPDLQQQIERLSWEFMVEANQASPEESSADDNVFLSEENDLGQAPANLAEPGKGKTGFHPAEGATGAEQDDQLGQLYANEDSSFFTPNDLGRQSGIIFDENKLEQSRITAWSKAPRLRPAIWFYLGQILAAPFIFINTLFSGLFSRLVWLVKLSGRFVYFILKNIILFPWQLLLAFKAALIYLFGDFSWIKFWPSSAAPAAVAVETDEPIPASLPFNRYKAAGGFMVMAFLLILPFGLYNLYHQGRTVKGQVMGAALTGIDHLTQAGLAGSGLDFNLASQQFNLAQAEFSQAEQSFRQLGLAAGQAAKLIPQVKAGEKLLLAAKNSAEIGEHLAAVGAVFNSLSLTLPADNDSSAVNLAGVASAPIKLADVNDELTLALDKAYATGRILSEINSADLNLGEYNQVFAAIQSGLPDLVQSLEKTRDMAAIITYFLGADEPRRWLFVFANNSELRPVLGFMGSYAIIDIKDGLIQNIEVPGGGFYDLKGSLAVKVSAWYPFSVFSAYGQPWNANYFPDFPASAETIQWFYDKSGGSSVDGIIAFSPVVLEKLLALTGEISLPAYNTAVNSQNFVRMAQIEVELEYDREENKPKQFIADLLPLVLEKTFALKKDDLPGIARIITDSLAEKHLLIYFNQPELEQTIINFGWGGEIKPTSRDYLSVIHTNVAGGKTDRVIKTEINHQAEIGPDGLIVNTVTIAKTHQGRPEDVFEGHINTDYLRVYVPAGSKLLSAAGFGSPRPERQIKIAATDEDIQPDPHLAKYEQDLMIDPATGLRISREFGKTCLAGWMTVAPGQTQTVTLTYLLPFQLNQLENSAPAAADGNILTLLRQYFRGNRQSPASAPARSEQIYSLLIQKQAGAEPARFTSQVILADGWQLTDYLPKTDELNLTNNQLIYQTALAVDKYYGIALTKQ